MMDAGTILGFLAASLQGKLSEAPPNDAEKLDLLKTLCSFLEQVDTDALKQASPVGFCVLGLLELTAPKYSLEHRLLALDGLLIILQKTDAPFHRTVMPATCSAMARLIGGLQKENHQVLIRSIDVLGIVLTSFQAASEMTPVVQGNLESLINGIRKVCLGLQDDRVRKKLVVFVERLSGTEPLAGLARPIILLGFTLDCPIDTGSAHYHKVVTALAEEKQKVAQDEKSLLESRLEALKFLAWSQQDGFDIFQIISGLLHADTERSLVESVGCPVDLNLALCGAPVPLGRLPEILGSHETQVITLFDYYLAKLGDSVSLDQLVSCSADAPEAAIVLLGRYLRVAETKADLVFDSALQICIDAPQTCSRPFLHFLVDASASCMFTPYWRYILMDVMTWMASPSKNLSSYALTAFQLICANQSCNPAEVLRANLPFVIDQIGLQIRCPTAYPLTPKVLSAVISLKIADSGTMARMTDIFEAVLDNLQAFRRQQSYVYDLLDALLACSQRLSDLAGTTIMPSMTPSVSSDDDEEKAVTPEERLAQQIMRIVVNFVLSDHRKIRIRSLTILAELCGTFAACLATEAFLPLVSDCWPFILGRASEADPAVVSAAMMTIARMTEVAGDFMQSRLSKELWPALKGLLERRGGLYTAGLTEFRLAVFSAFARICVKVKMCRRAEEELAWIVIDSLRIDAPSQLKESAMNLGRVLVAVSPDTLWFILACRLGAKPLDTTLDVGAYRRTCPVPGSFSPGHLSLLAALLP